MVRRHAIGDDERSVGTSYIGSFPDEHGPEDSVVVLAGDLDAAVVDRLAVHIDWVLAGATRFLMINASAVDSYDGALLDLLGRTQRRLGPRRGTLQVCGLHPSLLTWPAPGGCDRPEGPTAPGRSGGGRSRPRGH